MRKKRRAALRAHTPCVLALCMLGGCGIDQGGGLVTGTSQSTELVVIGPITGFGSVRVNGLTLETAATEILVDGTPVPQSALREGQIIRAVAAVTSSSIDATTIEYRQNVRGPLGQVDAAAGTLTVLGQPVETGTRTVLDIGGRTLDQLTVGEVVEISGIPTNAGIVRATYVGAAAPTDAFTVTTTITASDANNLTFALGALNVDYSQVLQLDVPTGIPDVGLVVEVAGTALGPNGELIVDVIRSLPAGPGILTVEDTTAPLAAFPGAPATTERNANVYGVITATNLPSGISLGDVEVVITPLTRVDAGLLSDLQPGRLVQVEGEVVTSGFIQADHIELL